MDFTDHMSSKLWKLPQPSPSKISRFYIYYNNIIIILTEREFKITDHITTILPNSSAQRTPRESPPPRHTPITRITLLERSLLNARPLSYTMDRTIGASSPEPHSASRTRSQMTKSSEKTEIATGEKSTESIGAQSEPKREKSPPGGRSSLRGEQRRSIESRITILEAALGEFAEKGYDAASIRSIGEKAGVHFTLVTYHFKNKRKLWEATIGHFFDEVSNLWQKEMSHLDSETPIDRLRHQFHSFLRFSLKYPDFHKALIHENRPDSPRFEWVIRYFVKPMMDATIPNISSSQKAGDIAECDTTIFYYLAIGACAALSSMAGELSLIGNIDTKSDDVVDEYWNIVDSLIFSQTAIR